MGSTSLLMKSVSNSSRGTPALAAEPRWQPVGPFGHDGLLLFPTGDPEILYVTTFYTGLYRSDDGGQSWRRVNPFFSGVLSVDPRDPDKLVGAPTAQGPAVRSVDGGRTFTHAGLADTQTIARGASGSR